jgi:hypothetical protein
LRLAATHARVRLRPIAVVLGSNDHPIMCHFITLIAPTGDLAAVSAVMARHGRDARPIDNPSVRQVLREGERQYLTTSGHCDCGSVLSFRPDSPETLEKKHAADEGRLRRKGWSDAKIARAMDDRRKAAAKPKGGSRTDSIDVWEAVLTDLRSELGLAHAGLFIRSYSGDIGDDTFQASRRVVRGHLRDGLESMVDDEVTIFS